MDSFCSKDNNSNAFAPPAKSLPTLQSQAMLSSESSLHTLSD